MTEAAISVILKPGKEPTDCGSYRPISLLNIDAKLFAGILAARLSPLMDDIIDLGQSGFIPTRQGADNTKRLLHLIDLVHRSHTPAFFLSIDAEKAFDCVDWEYLFKVLRAFGDNFLLWIRCLYALPTAAVRVNGRKSTLFPIARGTRQGCPLSLLLFALYMEPFAQLIQANPDIVGLKFGTDIHKINMYADDVILSLTQPWTTLRYLTKEITAFGNVAGFKVKVTNSQILNISLPEADVQNLQRDFPYKWAPADITYLGILLTSTNAKTIALNYSLLTEQTNKALAAWSRLGLAWFGRAVAVKMTVLPRILYIFQMPSLSPPPGALKLQELLNRFLCDNKKPRWQLCM